MHTLPEFELPKVHTHIQPQLPQYTLPYINLTPSPVDHFAVEQCISKPVGERTSRTITQRSDRPFL